MRLKSVWTRRVAMGFALSTAVAGAGFADTTVSASNDPATSLGGQMQALLGQERAAMGALSSGRLEQIVVPKVVPVVAATVPAIKLAAAVPVAAKAAAVKPVAAEPAAETVAAAAPAPENLLPFWLRPAKSEPATPQAPAAVQIRYDAGWLAAQPAASGDAQWECLAKAVYFEARGESVAGQVAVAEVVLNRVDSGLYPRSICGVVQQGSKYACQFSWVCDGYSDAIRERAVWAQVGKIARLMMDGAPRDLTDGATHFRTGAVRPAWSRTFPQTARIGSHYFYRQPMRIASN